MPIDEFTEPFLILCEGKSDESFLRHLATGRKLRGFQYACPAPKTDNAGKAIEGGWGKTGFYVELDAIKAARGFEDKLQAIVLVTDSDDKPKDACNFAKRQIKKAGEYAIPTDLLKPSTRAGKCPPVVVVTLPWFDKAGNLETLILGAVPDYFPCVLNCLDDYAKCAPNVHQWSVGKQSKMRLACIVAAVCKDDPTCSASTMWSDDKTKVFTPMLSHRCFDELAKFLSNLPSLVSGGVPS